MKSNTIRLFTFTSVMAIAMASFASGETFLREDAREFSAATFEKLVLKVDTADVEVTAWDKPVVEVKVLMSVKAGNAEKADKILANVLIELSEQAPVYEMKVKNPRRNSIWSRLFGSNADVTVLVSCPADYELAVSTGAGDLITNGVSGKLTFETGGGDVTVNDSNSVIHVETGAGDVSLNGFTGELTARTGAGDVDVTGSVASLNASTGAGDVSVRSANPISADSKVSTGAGSIVLVLPESSAFDLNASTGIGSIDCAFPLNDANQSRSSLKGTAGSNGPRLVLSTGAGSIELRF